VALTSTVAFTDIEVGPNWIVLDDFDQCRAVFDKVAKLDLGLAGSSTLIVRLEESERRIGPS